MRCGCCPLDNANVALRYDFNKSCFCIIGNNAPSTRFCSLFCLSLIVFSFLSDAKNSSPALARGFLGTAKNVSSIDFTSTELTSIRVDVAIT